MLWLFMKKFNAKKERGEVKEVEVKVLGKSFYLFFAFFAFLLLGAISFWFWIAYTFEQKNLMFYIGWLMMAAWPFFIGMEFALHLYSYLYYKDRRFVFCGEKISYGPNDGNGYLSFERSQVKEVEVFESYNYRNFRSYCRVTLVDDGWFVFDACNLDDVMPYLWHENVSLMRFKVFNRFSVLPD